MSNSDFAHICCIIDRSGSMHSIQSDAIGGFNAFIKAQKNEPGRAVFTLVLFNHEYAKLYDAVPLQDVQPLTVETYQPDGMTALLDAVGRGIDELGASLAAAPEEERPGKVIVAILTDGEENSSRVFTREQVFETISHQRDVYKWEFFFLAANQDAIQAGGSIGIAALYSMNFDATSDGIRLASENMSRIVASSRRV